MTVNLGQKSDFMKDTSSKKYKNNESKPSEANEPMEVYYPLSVNKTIALLGMQKDKQFKDVANDTDFIALIREGVPKEALNNMLQITGFTILEMANITHTTDRTLRRYTATDKLPKEQSERIIELARLYSKGIDVMGNIEDFRQWMDSNLLPFGNKKPKDFLDTSLGIDMLHKELGRIEHGIFA